MVRAALSEQSDSCTRRSAAEIRDWIIDELASLQHIERSSIDPGAALYSLGADSLMAFGITGGLADWLGRELPATLMWDYPSIDAIALALAQPDAAAVRIECPGVVNLQPLGNLIPLFCFPGAGGHPVTFAPLAAHLAPDHPCYGLTVPGLDTMQPQFEHVEQVAAALLQNIKRVQPHGPYQLAGYSYGGMLAFETAQQLTGAGETVSLLAIYDTSPPDGLALRPAWQRMVLHAWTLATRSGRREYFRQRLLHRQRVREEKDRVRLAAGNSAVTSGAKLVHEVEQANNRATVRYQPQLYRGSAVIFRAIDRYTQRVGYKRDTLSTGWATLTGGRCRIIDLPGNHQSVLNSENSLAAAEKLLPLLSKTLAL
jgi:thioesterase domain-containing protein/acyl carrier protein